jgi:hypothetical protein
LFGVVIAGGAAWAFWQLSGQATASATAGTALELHGSAEPRPVTPLYPGAKAPLRIRVNNENAFPVVVNQVRQGPGPVVVDSEHAAAGCLNSGLTFDEAQYVVSWNVGKKSSSIFTVPNGIKMTNASDSACQGATFTIPVVLSGKSR